MSEQKLQFLEITNHRAKRLIAYLPPENQGAGLLWLPGFHSSMESLKASAIAKWSADYGLAMTRFDYFGHGRSEGRPEQGTISTWLEDAETVLSKLTSGPQILLGSSMGGWIALRLLEKLMQNSKSPPFQIAALILIAPAWNMTEKLIHARLDSAAKKAIAEKGVYYTPSDYGDGPYPITRELLTDGRKHLIAKSALTPKIPIRILHGMQDVDVPWENSLELMEILGSDDVSLSLIKDGDHRLSRDGDIDRIKREIWGVLS